MPRRLSERHVKQIHAYVSEGFSDKAIREICQVDEYIIKDVEHGFIRPDLTGRRPRGDKVPQTPDCSPYVLPEKHVEVKPASDY